MGRLLKFRVWDVENNEYLISYGGRGEKFYLNGKLIDLSWFLQVHRVEDGKRFIVEQYTGLTDKNGVEIYEGDIVKPRKIAKGATVAEVIYNERACKFCIRIRRDGYKKNETHLLSIIGSEVIGNIHQNKEKL